jgi:hypothetical protein
MGWKGKTFVNDFDSSASCASTSKGNVDDKRNELFHIRVITKHTKIDTLIDGGSQVNLISEEVVKHLGLETKPHKKPYPLGWVCKDNRLQVAKICNLKFIITSKFINEVEFYVVPLDIYGILLGSPYLYNRKTIFYRVKNQYHLFKEGIEYIVHAHPMKNDRSFVTTRQLKMVVNASGNLTLMFVQQEVSLHENIYDSNEKVVPFVKDKYNVGTFSFVSTYLVLLFNFLLFNNVWLIATTMNVEMHENLIIVLNSVIAVFIVVKVSKMYRFQVSRTNDTGKVR